MAIDFPDSPTVDQQYSVGDRTWTWNGTYWQLSQTSSTFTASDTAPVSPSAGDIWFESDTGQTFVYYDQSWVEIGAATDLSDILSDADADTSIQVEASSDEDVIRFRTAGTERLQLTSDGHLIPQANVTYDLGSASNRFRDLYLSGSSIDLGGVEITSDGTSLTMPPVSNISGDFTVGTDVLHVDHANSRVGVGTTAPDTTLHIEASQQILNVIRAGNGTTYFDNYINDVHGEVRLSAIDPSGNNYSKFMTFATSPSGGSATERVRIDPSGNVGIGTTSPSDTLTVAGSTDAVVSIISEGSSPNNALAIAKLQGSGDLGHWDAITINGNDNVSYESRITWLFDSIVEGPIIGGLRTGSGTTDLTFHTTESEVANERMRITSSGRVGIGTTLPDFSLDVAGQVIVGAGDNITPNSFGNGHLMIDGAGYTGFASLDGTAMWVGHNSGSRNLYLATNETARVTVTGGGNVGIGTTGPQTSLHVKRGTGITAANYSGEFAALIYHASNASTKHGLLVANQWIADASTLIEAGNIYASNAAYTKMFYVNGVGRSYNQYGTWGTISDQTLKTDIVDAGNQLDDILGLRFVNYKFIKDVERDPETAPRLFGLVAQEVEQVSPGLVTEDGEGIKTVNTSVLSMKAVKAMQEMHAIIESQQTIISDLTARIEALEAN